MTTVKRPSRLFSFTDWNKTRPKDPPPGDRLDAMFSELASAIISTQEALAQIRRDDGRLKNQAVDEEHLATDLRSRIAGDIAKQLEPVRQSVSGTAINAQNAERSAQLFARDAEAAVRVAQQLTSGMAAMRKIVEDHASAAQKEATAADIDAIDAENWGNYALAQAQNAIAAKDEALQWAEYLAGPVVNSADAPAYIADSKFPHGLYYQPVEGGLAGLWSAKWWAIYAQQLVGKGAFYYLGAWPSPPLPGAVNPDTGQQVPNPLAPGSIYYDSTSNTLYVWNGTDWVQTAQLTKAYTNTLVYTATAGQTVFSGVDLNGQSPVVGISPSEVYVNGVRLVFNLDFTVDDVANTLTIADPLSAGSMVQWDLLVPMQHLQPGSVNAYKIITLVPDGVTTAFPIKYVDKVSGQPTDATVGASAELQVSLDGIVQEPGVDYTASVATLHMAVAPGADAHLWAVWYQPGASA